MTRKDYVLISNVFKADLDFLETSEITTKKTSIKALYALAGNLATQLYYDNPNFNRDRFLVACGVK